MKDLIFKPETHEYHFKHKRVPGVSEILQDNRLVDTQYFTEKSRKRGKLVHQITEWFDRGELEESSVDPLLVGYFEAYKSFRATIPIKIMKIEEPTYNHQWGYAGTPDRLFYTEAKGKAILSIKTGVRFDWHILQETGYQFCYKDLPKIFSLYLKDNGAYKYEEIKPDSLNWLAAVMMYKWRNRENG